MTNDTFDNMKLFEAYRKDRNIFLRGMSAAIAVGQSDVNFMEDPEDSMVAVGKAIASAFQLDPVSFVQALV